MNDINIAQYILCIVYHISVNNGNLLIRSERLN